VAIPGSLTGYLLPVDLYKVIRELIEERRRIDGIIHRLERVMAEEVARAKAPPKPKKRRGRKGMNPEQRLEVSERMRKYWAERRKAATKKTAGNGSSS